MKTFPDEFYYITTVNDDCFTVTLEDGQRAAQEKMSGNTGTIVVRTEYGTRIWIDLGHVSSIIHSTRETRRACAVFNQELKEEEKEDCPARPWED